MGEKFKRFFASLQNILKNVEKSSKKVMEELDNADKKIDKQIGELSSKTKLD
jgi:hypothetical protein